MAKLTTTTRNKLPLASFAGPGRSYPVTIPGNPASTRRHAANAKARATQAVKAGRMSTSTEAKIDAKANAALKRTAK